MARKSRVQKRALPEEPIVQWKAGVYARVSVSDNREHGESILTVEECLKMTGKRK